MPAVGNSHVQWRSATLFEFSLYDVILMAGVFLLIVLYVALLIYLKPSLHTKRSKGLSLEPKTPTDTQPSQEEEPVEPPLKPITAIEPDEALEETLASTEPVEEPEAEVETPEEPRPTLPTEVPEPEKAIAEEVEEPPRKRGPPGSPGCTHYFGYLAEIPKNNPIPDGCLGCLRLMECLIKRPTESEP
jgi:hypothetical protein